MPSSASVCEKDEEEEDEMKKRRRAVEGGFTAVLRPLPL